MKRFLVTLTLAIFVIGTSGQTTFTRYYDYYGRSFSDYVSVQDDGYLMAMISETEGFYLSFIKTDLNGDTMWTKNYEMDFEYITSVIGTDDEEGNIYLALQYGNENLIKVDQNANILWAKEYPTRNLELKVHDSILWVCRNAYPGNYLYKIDAATGDSLWRSALFNTDPVSGTTSHATSIVIVENGDLVVTVSLADTEDGTLLSSDFYRLEANSDELVKFTMNTGEEFVVCDSKNIGNEIISIANGRLYSEDHKTSFFIKYTTDGTIQQFKKNEFGYSRARLYDCVITSDNQVVAVGRADTPTVPRDIMIHCFSANGDSLWTHLQNRMEALGYDIALANDNGFVITGGYVIDDWKPYLLKTDSYGTLTNIPKKRDDSPVLVYPNPAIDQVIIYTPGIRSGKLTILNEKGKLTSEINITSENTIWHCDQVGPGVYLYKIESDNKVMSGKLVVN